MGRRAGWERLFSSGAIAGQGHNEFHLLRINRSPRYSHRASSATDYIWRNSSIKRVSRNSYCASWTMRLSPTGRSFGWSAYPSALFTLARMELCRLMARGPPSPPARAGSVDRCRGGIWGYVRECAACRQSEFTLRRDQFRAAGGRVVVPSAVTGHIRRQPGCGGGHSPASRPFAARRPKSGAGVS